METLVRDLRYAVRVLWHEPGFTLLAVFALALGIGATTAMFTVVDSVLLRPLAYKDSERLVVALHGPSATGPVSPADFFDYRSSARSFRDLAAAQSWGATLGGGERPEHIPGMQVSANMFDVLGVPPLVGRTFVAGDDSPGRDRIVVLGHALWQRRFASDPAIVGRSVVLDGEPFVVVGVMPRGFRFAPFWQTRAEMWVPIRLTPRTDDRSGRSLRVFARLADGVSVAQAQAEMTGIAARLERASPASNTGLGITVRPLLDKVVAGIRGTLVALLAMVAFVLVIACANVANTLLARASGRQREMAVRAALGATRRRVLRQLLTESVVLSASGAVIGLFIALWGVNWLLALLPPGSLPRQQDVSFDVRVFGVAAAATLLAGIATGLVPAWQLMKTNIGGAFQDGARGATEGGGRKRLRSVLVAAEVALALVLLVAAGLMARTMMNLSAVSSGFQVDHLAVATVSVAGTPHAGAAGRVAMFDRVRERLASLPGVTAVGAINHLPLAGDIWNLGYTIEGRPTPSPGTGPSAVYRVVQPGYFGAMRIPLVAGRDFTANDSAGAPHVAIINKAMADRQWPGENAVGRRITLPGPSRVQEPITIVGVAGDARQSDWTGRVDDEVYLSFPQRAGEFGLSAMTFVLRTAVDPSSIAAVIPREIATLDRGVPVTDAGAMSAVVAAELWRERLTAQLTGLFAAVSLTLAAIGVYAVVSYGVARRTRELGVRIALGATRGSVARLAVADAMRPVVAGSVAGLLLSLAASRFIQTFLYQVSATDGWAVAVAAASLVTSAAVAAWIPARRASRLDPVTALRRD